MLNTWRLFLDDERYPPDTAFNWKIARNVDDAVYYVNTYGLPTFMSLDHDMGYMKLSGKDFANWIVNYCLDNQSLLPNFYVHSQNPVGAENINCYLEKALKALAEQFLQSDGSEVSSCL